MRGPGQPRPMAAQLLYSLLSLRIYIVVYNGALLYMSGYGILSSFFTNIFFSQTIIGIHDSDLVLVVF